MATPPTSRRGFLAGLAGLLGLAGIGSATAWWRAGSASPTTTTSPAALRALPPATTGSSPAPTTTTVASAAAAETTTTEASSAATTSTTGPATTTTSASTTTEPPATTSTTSTTTQPPTTTAAPTASAASIGVLCRDAWGAQPAAGSFTSHTIERLTVHHTAALLGDNSLAPARARQHQNYHLSLGWPDLAYHFLVDANGNVYEGRPVSAVGDTGTNYDPTGHFLVCCEANFDEQGVPEAQFAALAEMLAWASSAYGVDPSTIRGHRDWASTTCPGDALYSRLSSGELESVVRARLDAGGVDVWIECGDSAFARVAAIEAGTA